MEQPEPKLPAPGAEGTPVANGTGLLDPFLRLCVQTAPEIVHLAQGQTLLEQGDPGDWVCAAVVVLAALAVATAACGSSG